MTRAAITVIGTSPAVLIRALALVRAGHAVRILERAPIAGGAWATPAALGCQSVEAAVHLLENRPDFHKVLQSLGIRLVTDTGAFVLWRGRFLPMASARGLFHGLVALNALRKGRLDQARRIATSALRSLHNRDTPFLYPVAGSAEVVAATLAALAREGVHPVFGCTVGQIAITPGRGVRCATSCGEVESDHILIASRAHAPIVIAGAAFHPATETDLIPTLLLRGTRPGPARFGYVEILRDRCLKRVRDVTRFCRPELPQDGFMLAVQLRAAGVATLQGTGVAGIVTRLEELGLKADPWAGLQSELHHYAHTTLTDASLRRLQRLSGGCVLTCPTTDLADGFILPPLRAGGA